MTKGRLPPGSGKKILAVLRRVKDQEPEILAGAKAKARQMLADERSQVAREAQNEEAKNPPGAEAA